MVLARDTSRSPLELAAKVLAVLILFLEVTASIPLRHTHKELSGRGR